MSGLQPDGLQPQNTDTPGLGLPIGIGSATAAAGLVGSLANNRSIRRAQSSLHGSAETTATQSANAASLERLKLRNEAALVRARIRVLASSSGTGVGGSIKALQRQATLNEALKLQISKENERNRLAKINAQLRAKQIELSNKISSPFADALTAGEAGFSAGVNLQRKLLENKAANTPLPQIPVDNSLLRFDPTLGLDPNSLPSLLDSQIFF